MTDDDENGLAEELFRSAIAQIEQAYVHFGHQFGWVFLHTPARTLSRDSRLFLIALNPASKQQNPPPEKSDERGNAYRLGKWKGNRPSSLQTQVCAFYRAVAANIGTDWKLLMDSSLAGNFCPFGSPSWAELPARSKSLAFSTDLWTPIVQRCAPSAVICLGEVCYRYMNAVAQRCGYSLRDSTRCPTGWGVVTYSVGELAGPNDLLLVRLPHLSRYRIFDRDDSGTRFQVLIDKVAAHLGVASAST